ncbi:hypothetical protein SDC9_151779 [bioreactor metagenome]|uniref:Uncharacterized protein n=1 Tax=bioreactor metagenome TaxID=1076179 RepID=A0A645ER80_9ZZZZ
MCVNRGVSVTEEASMVVSESGEILSPKYAPEMMAPAIHPSSNPCALPIPISAMPMVAMVVHELPVMTDTSEQMMHVEARKKLG